MSKNFCRKTYRCGLLTAGALFVAATTVAAQELPRFDVDAYCHKLAVEMGGDTPSNFGACKSNEQMFYDALTGGTDLGKTLGDAMGVRWDKASAAVREDCLKHSLSWGYHSYQAVIGCLSAASKATVPFRY
jgi:hypothetical protein